MGGGIGKLVRFGKLPVDYKLQGFGYLETPEGGPDWSVQFAIKFLFPKNSLAGETDKNHTIRVTECIKK